MWLLLYCSLGLAVSGFVASVDHRTESWPTSVWRAFWTALLWPLVPPVALVVWRAERGSEFCRALAEYWTRDAA